MSAVYFLSGMDALLSIYTDLFALYGPQGWWPLGKGYHPGDYSPPRAKAGIFEVYLGAVLTQNSSWNGASMAIGELKRRSCISASALLALPAEELEQAIRPARYWKQKARYLRGLAEFFMALRGRIPSREELLAQKGIGQETADSILLYAYHQPVFVVDTYTRRFFAALGILTGRESYAEIQNMFMNALPRDAALFNEYHALIVRHARAYYSRKPHGVGDPLGSKHSESEA
ncbi:MAG: endonuclease III domain-containing protein [Spirochaetota bacterium]|jgi:endonuclease-3 related protein|nr:endonuclease III domain-containing protein [Spirochaetota bacterium]